MDILAFQFLSQRAVLLPADETSLVSCPRCSFQAIGQHFAFACENGVVCALAGNAIVRRSWFNPPDPFDLDVFWQLSPCATRCCYEHADGVCGGKVEHGDDGFAVEQGTGPDGHDCPCIRVAWIGHPLFKLVEPVSDFRNAPRLAYWTSSLLLTPASRACAEVISPWLSAAISYMYSRSLPAPTC